MNKHFKDAAYYARRAATHAFYGVRETLEPVETRVRRRLGYEQPEPESRVETLVSEAKAVEGEARNRVAGVTRWFRSS
ncbi:DUF7553 family protein [Natronobiforma cellulositropha]|uniref:DUF7553 family protein n=1 Tax=Natronobiforma cellulositropha TaxID=1679076 RepID=UPI0021D5BE1F|nr:hypothetical protein [Natronobiforma cellulositropha]